MYSSKPYKIESVKTYTPEIKLIRIKSNLNPKPGEFIEVSLPGIGECPLASCSYNKNYIDMLTRNAGNVTSAIFQKKKGETINIRGPYGKPWPIKKLKNKDLILVAGGTGIAPITSLIEYIEKNRKYFKEVFIYLGFRDEDHILLRDKLEIWKKKFKLKISLDKSIHEIDKFTCKIGFVQDILSNHALNPKNHVALLCGPEVMMHCVTDKLISKGVKPNKIYWSLERRMECGFGSCGRCQIQDVYVCKDGPIFRYDIIKPKLDNEESANEVETN